ncbi:hypothetical protein KY317_01795 [Candidatus Woesearchaeota archaeon]|nr:hypothetical protein [Candidatus Woesearchaeota archaeon]
MEKKKKERPDKGMVIFAAVVSAFMLILRPTMFISLAIGWLCAYKCHSWAVKVKGDKLAAFLIGFVFGIFGLLGIWIFYRKRLRKVKR